MSGNGSDAGRAPRRWIEIPRERFEDLWLALPHLTVLAATPGWGRTTWMRRCRDALAAAEPQRRLVWVSSRRGLERSLDALVATDVVTVFVDDVLHTRDDPLWPSVAEASAAQDVQIVVSAVDEPWPGDIVAAPTRRIIDERVLCFDDDELDELVAANDAPRTPDLRHALGFDAHGCPYLVRHLIERARASIAGRRTLDARAPLEDVQVSHVLEQLPPDAVADSAYLGFIERASCFRRFTAAMVVDASTDPERRYAQRLFARLRSSPLGDFEVDPVTGEEQFVWAPTTWRRFARETDADTRRARLRFGLDEATRRGLTGSRMFSALELEDYALAEKLAIGDHRLYQRYGPPEVEEKLIELSGDAIGAYPFLRHLSADIRMRRLGPNPESLRGMTDFLDRVRPRVDASPLMRLRIAARRSLAAVTLGDRALTRRSLRTVADQLEDDSPVTGVLVQAAEDAAIAEAVAAELPLAFWAATQIDEHAFALRLARRAVELSPQGELSRDNTDALATESDFAGLRSRDPDGLIERSRVVGTQALSFFALEEGDDAAALASTRALTSVPRFTTIRSAGDGYVLMVRALAAPQSLDAAEVSSLIELHGGFWTDGRISTFTAFGATCAYLALGRRGDAEGLWQSTPSSDWFSGISRGLLALNGGDAGDAVARFTDAGSASALPRMRAVSEVLLAASLLRIGHEDVAAARLSAHWHAQPAPRLIRFALRFVSDDDLTRLTGLEELAPAAEDVLREARRDSRHLHRAGVPAMSDVELDTLRLLREGMTNSQIAARRYVSENTVRTQLRQIFRKLSVNDRADAVAAAERAGLLRS